MAPMSCRTLSFTSLTWDHFSSFFLNSTRKVSFSVNEKRQLNTQRLFEDPTMVSWSLDKPSFRTSKAIGTWLKPDRSGLSQRKKSSTILSILSLFSDLQFCALSTCYTSPKTITSKCSPAFPKGGWDAPDPWLDLQHQPLHNHWYPRQEHPVMTWMNLHGILPILPHGYEMMFNNLRHFTLKYFEHVFECTSLWSRKVTLTNRTIQNSDANAFSKHQNELWCSPQFGHRITGGLRHWWYRRYLGTRMPSWGLR